MFVAAQAGLGLVDFGKQGNPLLEQVQAISILGEERELSPQERELEDMRGPVVAQDYRDDPRLNGKAKEERTGVTSADGISYPAWLVHGDDVADQNQSGSYEALTQGWMDGWGKKSFDVSATSGEGG